MRRRWPVWLLLLGVLLLVATRFVEVRQFAATLVAGRWEWMLAALLLQGAYYLLYAAMYQAGFATVGVASRLRDLVPVILASIFAGTVAPSGGLSSAAVLIDDASRRQQSPARAAEGILLVWVAGLASVVPVLLIGLGYLYLQGALEAFAVAGALVYLLYVAALTGALLLALWQPSRLRRLLRWLQRTLNRLAGWLCRPPLVAEDWARKNATESTGAAYAIVRNPRKVSRTLAAALAVHLANVACLYAVFLAFDQAVGLGALAAGFSLGFVFSIINVVPFDLGVVEGIMAVVYTSLGVPAATALVIALAFRGLTAWLPVAVSFLLFGMLWREGRG